MGKWDRGSKTEEEWVKDIVIVNEFIRTFWKGITGRTGDEEKTWNVDTTAYLHELFKKGLCKKMGHPEILLTFFNTFTFIVVPSISS